MKYNHVKERVVMGMFDDVLVNAKSAANAVGRKASELVDLSKLRLSAADLNGEISQRFQALGRDVYSAHKSGIDPSAAIESASADISDLLEQLEAVNAQLAAAHAKVVCGYCGQENPQDAAFCTKCGHKLSEEKPPVAPAAKEEPAGGESCCKPDDE
jgi:ribosomal protein L40E